MHVIVVFFKTVPVGVGCTAIDVLVDSGEEVAVGLVVLVAFFSTPSHDLAYLGY